MGQTPQTFLLKLNVFSKWSNQQSRFELLLRHRCDASFQIELFALGFIKSLKPNGDSFGRGGPSTCRRSPSLPLRDFVQETAVLFAAAANSAEPP